MRTTSTSCTIRRANNHCHDGKAVAAPFLMFTSLYHHTGGADYCDESCHYMYLG